MPIPYSGTVVIEYHRRSKSLDDYFHKRPLKKSDPLFGLDLEHEYELIQATSSKLPRTLRDRIVAIMEQRNKEA